MGRVRCFGLAASLGLGCVALLAADALADSPAPPSAPARRAPPGAPDGAAVLRLLGPQAAAAFAPATRQLSALDAYPPGLTAEQVGAIAVAPGIGKVQGRSDAIVRFAAAHPDLPIEVGPVLHTLLDAAGVTINAPVGRKAHGVDGTNTLIGMADTGIDVTHPSLQDEFGATRVAWLLDLSLPPFNKYPDLEAKYGVTDPKTGKVVSGAVYAAADIQAILSKGNSAGALPTDEVGHGTHVTSIAAGNGQSAVGGTAGAVVSPYVGVAPKAGIVFARVTRAGTEAIENNDLLLGTAFMFDRAAFMKLPIAVNLSIGTDFGPHDGTMMWEQTLASYVGPSQPGRALVVAAGNSGSISDSRVHQVARVAKGSRTRVPVTTAGATSGGIQIWVTKRPGSNLKVGLDGPDGEWIAPVSAGDQQGKNTSNYNAGVIHGSTVSASPIPAGSDGAVVVWQGQWPSGIYNITFDGEGTVDLFFQATGDAGSTAGAAVGFTSGVREGTINLPGTHPSIIAVGCTLNHPSWTSISGGKVSLRVPLLDAAGGIPSMPSETRPPSNGEICWFSSAGPTVTGVAKPEIAAPGGGVIAAMSREAAPGSAQSIFSNSSCPAAPGQTVTDARCLQIDSNHAVAIGTSMSAPLVAGTIALLFQRDPTLTQDKLVTLLQAGAHPLRTDTTFYDQAGPGELDVEGSLNALDAMQTPALQIPVANHSWIALSSSYAPADGSAPVQAVVELRSADGIHPADLFDASRLVAKVEVVGKDFSLQPTIVRKGPGLWSYSVPIPPGLGGALLVLGATFDGVDIVTPKSIPIATDPWTARYASSAGGSGCAVALPVRRGPAEGLGAGGVVALCAASVVARRGRRRRAGA